MSKDKTEAKPRALKKPLCELCQDESKTPVNFSGVHRMNLCPECKATADGEKGEPVIEPDLPKRRTEAEIAAEIVEQAKLLEARKLLSFAPMFKLVRELKLLKHLEAKK